MYIHMQLKIRTNDGRLYLALTVISGRCISCYGFAILYPVMGPKSVFIVISL
jgi:hypothetical protein